MKFGEIRQPLGRMLVCIGAVFAAASCQTTPEPSQAPPPEVPLASEVPFAFVPASFAAPIRSAEVRYRMLFAPESHAIWITDEVNELKLNSDRQQGIDVDDSDRLTAEIANAQFIVIECRLESAFADASVAYDVVGLRNMDVYMETPSGQRIYPIQKIMAPEAEESNQGALIRFARTSVIVFPKSSALDRSASPLSGAPGARLVIDGFHSRFYFEWTNMLQGDVIEVSDGPFNPEEAFVNAVRTGYTSIYSLLSPLQRIVE